VYWIKRWQAKKQQEEKKLAQEVTTCHKKISAKNNQVF